MGVPRYATAANLDRSTVERLHSKHRTRAGNRFSGLQRIAAQYARRIESLPQRTQAGEVGTERHLDLALGLGETWPHLHAVNADGVSRQRGHGLTRPPVARVAVFRIRPDGV